MNGAGDEIRTRDINLGKVALYQLSYSRTGAGRLANQRPNASIADRVPPCQIPL
jgi:hypothetical protein